MGACACNCNKDVPTSEIVTDDIGTENMHDLVNNAT